MSETKTYGSIFTGKIATTFMSRQYIDQFLKVDHKAGRVWVREARGEYPEMCEIGVCKAHYKTKELMVAFDGRDIPVKYVIWWYATQEPIPEGWRLTRRKRGLFTYESGSFKLVQRGCNTERVRDKYRRERIANKDKQ